MSRRARVGVGLTLTLAISIAAPAAVLLKYEMNQPTPTFQDAPNALEGGPVLAGNGVGSFSLPSGLAYASAPVCGVAPAAGVLPLNTASAALAAECMIYLDVRVGANVEALNLQSLTFDIARGGASTNRGFGVYVTTPTTADVVARSSTYILAQRFNWESQTVNLSGISGLQGLRAGDVLRVKLPFWTADAVQSVEIDNLTLQGTVQPGSTGNRPAELAITGTQRLGSQVSLTWNSQTGKVYVVEFSADLSQWYQFPSNVLSAGASTTTGFDLAGPVSGGEQVLVQYRMGQLAPQTFDPVGGASGGNLLPGAGLNEFDVAFNGYISSPALLANFLAVTPDVATALGNQSTISFDLTVGPRVADLNLTSLSFNAARGGSSTPRGYGVYVTTPVSTNQLVQPGVNVNSVRPNWEAQSVNLSGVGSLQHLRAGQQVRFRMPIYSPATGNSLELDDLTVRGVVAAPPVDLETGQLYLRVRELPGEPVLVQAATQPTGATWNWYSTRTLAQLPSPLNAAPPDVTSASGGWLSFRTNATGFFRTLKLNDRWWLVDPQGYLFLHKGVAVVSTVNSPGANAALAAKFGNANNWAVATSALLRTNGFNGAGAWSDNSRLKPVPYPLARTVIASFLGTYDNTNSGAGYPQVFDATFPPFCQVFAQQFAAFKNEAALLGYFSDNELNFPSSLLPTWLGLTPGNSSYEEAWRWLRERYGPGATVGQVTTQDRLDFLGHVWGRYYSVVNQAIKQHDPNHLYLGSRFYSSDKDRPEIFRAIGPHVDIVSVNHYSQWTPDIDRIRMWEAESGRPVFITEFYVKGEDSGMPNNTGAGWVVRTQEDRGRFYENFVLTLLESRVCVGWHWFKYADNDPDSNPDPSNIDSNKGIVSNRYDPYYDLLDNMRRLNERTYRLTEYFDHEVAP